MKKRSRTPVRVRGATSHTHIDGCFNPASLLEVVREAVLLEVGREAELGGHAIKCAGGERGGNCTVSTFDGARAFRLGDERVRKRLVPPVLPILQRRYARRSRVAILTSSLQHGLPTVATRLRCWRVAGSFPLQQLRRSPSATNDPECTCRRSD